MSPPRRLSTALSLALVACASRRPAGTDTTPADRRITVVFRLDDYSSRSPTNLEARLIDAFRRYRIPVTVGVVPFVAARTSYDPSPQEVLPLSAEKIALLKDGVEDGTVEVALHGYSHQTRSGSVGGWLAGPHWPWNTEFRGMGRRLQEKRLASGRAFLEEAFHTRVETFIPPWNSYDRNLLHALEAQGFLYLSAARQGPASSSPHLKFVPETCRIAALVDAVGAARRTEDPELLIVTLLHPSDFLEIDPVRGSIDIQEFGAVLAWIASQRDVRVLSIRQAAREITDLGAKRFFWNRTALLWDIAPGVLETFLPRAEGSLYLSTAIARSSMVRSCLLLLLCGLGAATLSAALASRAGMFLFTRFGALRRVSPLGAPLLGGLVLVAIQQVRSLRPDGALASALVAGGCAGIWRCAYRLRGSGRSAASRRGRARGGAPGERSPQGISGPPTPAGTASEARRPTGGWSRPESSGRRPS